MTAQEELARRIERDSICRAVQKKIDEGKADFSDTAQYNDRAAELLGEVLAAYVPDMPPDERETLCKGLLRQRYLDTNATLNAVQRTLDAVQGLHLAPQIADYPEERVDQAAHSLADETVPMETIQRRAKSAPATIARSFQDDYIQKNASFRDSAGLKCYITRIAAGGCCKWCTAMAGRYSYGEEPDDIYRRHDNCSCTVTYENGRKRQDVWSKRTWKVPEASAGASDPTRLTAEQAQFLQAQNRQTVLTNALESAKINVEEFTPAKTIDEANAFARDVLGIPNASYKGVDIRAANEWNRGLVDAFSRFPELREQFKFVGSIGERNEIIYQALFSKHLEMQKQMALPGADPRVIEEIAKQSALAELQSRFVPNEKTYAQSWFTVREKELIPANGVSINEIWGNQSDRLERDLIQSVSAKLHPEKCSTIRSVLDHEIGHQLDKLLDVSKDSIVRDIIDALSKSELTEYLSMYSWKNNKWDKGDHYSEAIAEAWSEYCNNPEPRQIAAAIGQRIMELYRIKYGKGGINNEN